MPKRFLLIGGIGSGKSTAGAVFAGWGVLVLPSDEFARSALNTREITAWVAGRWPEVMVGGEIDRSRLGRLVFPDPALLAELEEKVHPETRRALSDAVDRHGGDIAIEMPILRDWFEGWPRVVVDAPDVIRQERAAARRSDMTAADVGDIMARQPSRADWLAAADYVIDNGGDLAQLRRQCGMVWERLGSA